MAGIQSYVDNEINRSNYDVVKLMKESLPEYVCNCFITSGYDSIDAICEMNVSLGGSNSIVEIEKFIDKRQDNLPFCLGPHHHSSLPFEFPPGHRIRITKFIQKIQKQHGGPSYFEPLSSKAPSKATKAIKLPQVSSEPENVPAVSNDIRRLIVQWVKGYNNGELADSIENQHYFINVSTSTIDPSKCIASVRCCCGKSFLLQKKQTGKGQYIISNWSKHYKQCRPRQNNQSTLAKQECLTSFFPSHTQTNPSKDSVTASSINTEISIDESVNFPNIEPEINNSIAHSLSVMPLQPISISPSVCKTSDSVSSVEQQSPTQCTSQCTVQLSVQSSPPMLVVSRNPEHSKSGQDFRQAPPSCEGGASELVDWSRAARKRRKLEEVGADCKQNVITEYFEVVDKIAVLVKENQKLANIILSINKTTPESLNVTPILQELMENAKKNSNKYDKQRRYSMTLKKFGTLLYIFCGSMAYEFVQHNLAQALPSLRTVQKLVHSQHTYHEGVFRFDELLKHLQNYQTPLVVAVAEDATRIIQKVEYDEATDKCVGFVLPRDENGLPCINAYKANSFNEIENMFKHKPKSKYVYLYSVTPLTDNVPSFPLACIGSDNKFTAKDVLLVWNYVRKQLSLRGIHLLSYASDGDSRLLRAMCITSNLHVSKDLSKLSPTHGLQPLHVPGELNKWLCTRLFPLLCVQDMVHLGVKLKARLLKPSIILPLGNFIATSAHLHILLRLHGKDVHNLRRRDIDHKDRQNFDAVEHIIKASSALESMPDAKGTKCYIDVMAASIYSYLDKTWDIEMRLTEMWFSVFFVRYWRQWISLHPNFSLKQNFITSNAYMCIEINAHSLLGLVLMLRDSRSFPGLDKCFMPWNMGSQSCEKTFRSLRSMSGTFSTIVNFSMLGFLQRIHKLSIKDELHTQSELGISFPRQEKNENKEGVGVQQDVCFNITDELIYSTLQTAETKAKQCLEDLGMAPLLKEKDKWKTPPIAPSMQEWRVDDDGEDENETDEENTSATAIDNFVSYNSAISDIITDVNKLHEHNLVDSSVKDQAKHLKASAIFEKDNSSVGLPLYKKSTDDETETPSQFVEVSCNNRSVYIKKRTAVWLFQETERVSSDRIFRVRSKQPFDEKKKQIQSVVSLVDDDTKEPIIADYIIIGDVCSFQNDKIGRVLQFVQYDKNGKLLQYKGNFVTTQANVGVLCTWYTRDPSEKEKHIYKIVLGESVSAYYPISNYLCTLTKGCIIDESCTEDMMETVIPFQSSLIAIKSEFELHPECFNFIVKNKNECTTTISPSPPTAQSSSNSLLTPWITIDKRLVLGETEKSLLINGNKLNDIHITAAQYLLRKQFNHLNGLQSPVYQLSKPLLCITNTVQIIHVCQDHWSVISTIKSDLPNQIQYYDSAYMKLPVDVEEIINSLLAKNSKCHKFEVTIMPTPRQSGSTECGLYSIAIATALAHNLDPTTIIFKQEDMRSHLLQCFENRRMEPFPVYKTRRMSNKALQKVYVYNCPKCYKGEDGREMVMCEKCYHWYHETCVPLFDKKDTWYGPCCVKL